MNEKIIEIENMESKINNSIINNHLDLSKTIQMNKYSNKDKLKTNNFFVRKDTAQNTKMSFFEPIKPKIANSNIVKKDLQSNLYNSNFTTTENHLLKKQTIFESETNEKEVDKSKLKNEENNYPSIEVKKENSRQILKNGEKKIQSNLMKTFFSNIITNTTEIDKICTKNSNQDDDKFNFFKEKHNLIPNINNYLSKPNNLMSSKTNIKDSPEKSPSIKAKQNNDIVPKIALEKMIVINNDSRKTIKKFLGLKEEIGTTKLKDNSDSQIRKIKSFSNVYDSFSDEEYQSDDGKESPFIIDDSSLWKKIWDLLIIILVFYSCTVKPFFLTFPDLENNLLYLDVTVDIFFIIDLIFNFFTPFYKHDDIKIQNPRKIVMNYLFSWFFFDLASSAPISLIALLFSTKSKLQMLGLIKIARVYKIIRWSKIFRISKLFSNRSKLELISEVKINHDSKVDRILKFSLFFFILMHISSCAWIYLAMETERYYGYVNWISFYNFKDMEIFDIYMSSFYFNLVTIYTIGYGDITSRNVYERIYNSLFMIIGVMLFSFAISSLSSVFSSNTEEEKNFKNKFDTLLDIKKIYKIPDSMFMKIRNIIKFQIKNIKMENFELLNILPYSLKREVILSMYRKGLSHISFFQGQDRDFIIYVLPLFRSIRILKNETLISIGDYIEEMYVVTQGVLSIRMDKYYQSIEIAHIRMNMHFGEVFMYLNENSPYLVNCKSSQCNLLSIKKEDYTKIKLAFNENILNILKNSCQLLEIFEKTRKIVMEMHASGLNIIRIKFYLKRLNSYLLKKQFDGFFHFNFSLEEAEDFMLSHDSGDIINFLNSEMEEKDFIICFVNDKTRVRLSRVSSLNSNSEDENKSYYLLNQTQKTVSEKENESKKETLDEIQIDFKNDDKNLKTEKVDKLIEPSAKDKKIRKSSDCKNTKKQSLNLSNDKIDKHNVYFATIHRMSSLLFKKSDMGLLTKTGKISEFLTPRVKTIKYDNEDIFDNLKDSPVTKSLVLEHKKSPNSINSHKSPNSTKQIKKPKSHCKFNKSGDNFNIYNLYNYENNQNKNVYVSASNLNTQINLLIVKNESFNLILKNKKKELSINKKGFNINLISLCSNTSFTIEEKKQNTDKQLSEPAHIKQTLFKVFINPTNNDFKNNSPKSEGVSKENSNLVNKIFKPRKSSSCEILTNPEKNIFHDKLLNKSSREAITDKMSITKDKIVENINFETETKDKLDFHNYFSKKKTNQISSIKNLNRFNRNSIKRHYSVKQREINEFAQSNKNKTNPKTQQSVNINKENIFEKVNSGLHLDEMFYMNKVHLMKNINNYILKNEEYNKIAKNCFQKLDNILNILETNGVSKNK